MLDLTPSRPGPRSVVQPVLFLPRDASLSPAERTHALALLRDHVALSQDKYRALLGTTFEASAPSVVQSAEPYVTFVPHANNAGARVDRIGAELLAKRGEDRYSSNAVFAVVFVRPTANGSLGEALPGGGLPFNGSGNTGGGYLELDYASLISDTPYPFQSSLEHELGHAFGLPHADCHGYDLANDPSMMSYNRAHWTRGLTKSPATFGPEDYYLLSLNRRAFPDFVFDPARHDPQGRLGDGRALARCLGPAMGAPLGPFRDLPGVGFELFYDGKRVNGPDAALYPRGAAEDACAWSVAEYPNITVTCTYNGRPL
jgi:hypothetical protein